LDGLAQRESPFTAQQRMLVAGAVGASVLFAICLISAEPEVALAPAAIIGIVVIYRAARYAAVHPAWLVCPLVLVELLTGAWFLSSPVVRAVFHYGLTALFCLPMLPAAWRDRTFRRGGFGLYTAYFLWAAVTVSFSLAPEFSAGRLLSSVMIFGALTVIASRVNDPEEIPALLVNLLTGCGIVVAMVALSTVVLPRSITWVVPTENSGADDVVRFSGIFNGPNDVGELMLVTVGCAAALWPSVSRRRRWLLGALIALALGAAALADSRTPFVALIVGGSCYLVWKYRGRALVLLLVVGLAASAMRFADSRGYLGRGDVGTLTGRTDVWHFAIGEIERSPILGYGYEVGGAILSSRYFPIWWGPWDEGPHSSLHNGYINRAVGVGLPATLLWFFIVLRPWYDVLRRREDPWGLKRVAFFMVIPMLVHNLAEVSISDCGGAIGLSFALVWALAERSRMLFAEQDEARRREELAKMPPAVAALTAGLLAFLSLIAFPGAARAQSAPAHGVHFTTLPPHAALPSGAQCAQAVSDGNSWEPRPGNSAANHTVPTFAQLAAFHLAPIKGRFAPPGDFARVNGRFTGTTDQILRWGACKWGIDEDVVRAEAVVESHWRQDDVGDQTNNSSLCPSGQGFPGAWDGANCQQSYGIMQMKFSNFGGWPSSKDSTAFNVDFRLAYQRLCMNGDISYLGDQPPPGDYPRYPLGSTDEMLWGCMGDWFTGSWYDAGAIKYIAEVKSTLAQRTWARAGF
ncbi:MAG TPA: O-antigen ligase family protein, partial [Candidatus Binataceae bacterium]|nr:O-antigen ligase family protein [Candidatus Binataceae bacterium]